MGFVFAPKSRRYVTGEQAGTLRNSRPPFRRWGCLWTRNQGGRLPAGGRRPSPSPRQGRGGLSGTAANSHRETHHPGVSGENPKGPGAGGEQLGGLHSAGLGRGNRSTFDWSLLKHLRRPYLLAGGLGPDNVAQAIQVLHPWGVDVSSGIETGGVKDFHKMAALCGGRTKGRRDMTNPKGPLRNPRRTVHPETLMNAVIELEEAYEHYKKRPGV